MRTKLNMSGPQKRSRSPENLEVDVKQKKVENNGDADLTISFVENHTFTNFVVDKILGENSQQKIAFIQGHYDGSDDTAVVILEKKPFSKETIKSILGGESETVAIMKNDIYHTFSLLPQKEQSAIKTTLIYPATQKHIDKYQHHDQFIIQETYEDYSSITQPYILQNQLSIQWVYNILEKKQEAERIVFEDPDPETGFILLPDLKWDCKQLEDLYLVAIIHKRGIKSLRDLRQTHLPLLRNILYKGTEAIKDKYAMPSSKLRIFVHYQPSFYHFHVHFTHLEFNAPGSSIERGYLLTDIIGNIEMVGDYYARKTLSFVTKHGDGLYELFSAKGQISQ